MVTKIKQSCGTNESSVVNLTETFVTLTMMLYVELPWRGSIVVEKVGKCSGRFWESLWSYWDVL